ncbi:alpha/beta hydrolase fold-domain-containing protein [Absidia repens]|uniref:Alpha/beta hydrolase fold-domain-containing protein n=1 Tax=Absidia repens TaxID=90262 RepID=A0A1X2I574_9FUNG|nr:alpha/beta hydrolase fold-domain-containing protein [Absidia repens]
MSKKAPAHPAYQAGFEAMTKAGFSIISETIEQGRIAFNKAFEGGNYPETIVEKKVITAGLDNLPVELTIVRPPGTENDVLPGLVFLHGGGWATGGFITSERIIKNIVTDAHVVVIFVDYRLSPEVKFPVAVEECYSSTLWVHENASTIKVDPSKLVVGGDSAGGNLSAAVSIMLAQRGHQDVLRGQILIYPCTAHDRKEYESFQTYGDGDYLLSRKDIAYFQDAYYDSDGSPADVRNAPLLATLDELKNVPRALVVTAECDILRDEGEAYARKLTEAGVDTCCVRVIGATHGFATAPLDTPLSRQALNLISNFLGKEAFKN